MEVVYPCCCGLDVHKKSITACVLWAEAKGKSRKEKKRFGTFTHDLLQLADWLAQCGVTHLVMESTAVPGQKTDQKNSKWTLVFATFAIRRYHR